MKNLLKWGLLASLSTLTLIGCASDAEDVLGTDPDTPIDETATIIMNEVPLSTDDSYASIQGEASDTVEGRVIFTSDSKQRRLYVTQTLPGFSPEPFLVSELSNKGTKADGSIDLDGDTTNTLDFTFDLNVPSNVSDGSIIYNFWTTSGKGDFRNSDDKLVVGVGTIEVSVGTGVNPNELVRTFNGVTMLEAPLGDGSSETFMSLLDGEIYTINQGAEVAALWDFGYYYGASGLASFASANDYPASVFDILPVANANIATGEDTIERADLNTMYFALSSKTTTEFDAITLSSELSDIQQSTNQRVNQLVVGDVVEFVDGYGVKGLIKVNNITGTDGSTGSITFDIKAQSYSPIIN